MPPSRAFRNNKHLRTRLLSKATPEQVERCYPRYTRCWDAKKTKNGRVIGCPVHGDSHARYAQETGIPEVLLHLHDYVYDLLPKPVAIHWPLTFLSAPLVGTDLSRVWPEFALWMLGEDVPETIEPVATLYRTWIATHRMPPREQFEAQAVLIAAPASIKAARARKLGLGDAFDGNVTYYLGMVSWTLAMSLGQWGAAMIWERYLVLHDAREMAQRLVEMMELAW